MKNKRTKLTAILLSALMAVSTISSVTWAADLFSDGSDSVVTTGESVEETTKDEINEVTESEQNELFTEETTQKPVVSISWSDDSTNFTNSAYFDLESGKYYLPVTYHYVADGSDEGTPGLEEITSTGKIEKATCEHPEYELFEFTVGNLYYNNVKYYHKDGWVADTLHSDTISYLHIKDAKGNDTTFKDATCETAGEGIKYIKCEYCGEFVDFSASTTGHYVYDKLTAPATTIEAYYSQVGNKADGKFLVAEVFPATGHYPSDLTKDVVPPENSSYNDYNNSSNTNLYGTNSSGKPYNKLSPTDVNDAVRNYFEDKANCVKNSDGTFSGKLDSTGDVYYYEFKYCTKCGKTLNISRKTLYDADITEGEKFYKAGENVCGFVDKNGVPHYSDYIKESNFGSVILTNCEIGGEYYLCTSRKDMNGDIVEDYSVVTTKIAPAEHNWMPATATWYGTNTSVDSKLIKYEDGEWVVYSPTCDNSNYFYELKQYCYSKYCKHHTKDDNGQYGISRTSIAGRKQAKKGAHVYYTVNDIDENGYPLRYIDPAATKYTYVDEQHHKEEYKDHVECSICGYTTLLDSTTPPALVEHSFAPREIIGADKKDPTCGETGYFYRAQTCKCLTDPKDSNSFYYVESTKTMVTVPATDKHVFGDNKAFIKWSGGSDIDGDGISDGVGAVYIKGSDIIDVSLHADIVRECTVCHKLDSNGINIMEELTTTGSDVGCTTQRDHFDDVTHIPAGQWCATLIVSDIVPASKDPNTGISYRCSTAHATISVDWVGTVAGKITYLNKDTVDNAVKIDVPYYGSVEEYQARTAHTPGKPQKEGDRIITRCTVCGDIVSNDPDNTPSVGVPTVTAASVDFDTVNVSWTKVEGATAYRLYFRSSDEGINKWQRIRTFTGDATSYSVNGLTTGSKYRFTVRAEITQDGKTTLGDYSKKGAVAVPKLTAPEIKTVTASGKATKVTWSRVDGASGYIVFRNSQRVGTVTKGSKVTWTDKKPVSGAKYQLRAYRTEDKKNFKSDLSEPK